MNNENEKDTKEKMADFFEEYSHEELTSLCRKQEEYIKELEEKLKTPSDTEKDTETLQVAELDYDELVRKIQALNEKILKLKEENEALRYSLTRMYRELQGSQTREEMWEENYYEEHKRANKLYDEWEELKWGIENEK